MPIYERVAERGARRGRFLVNRAASELLTARIGAAMSQREVGRLLGISHSKVGRAERGEPDQLTIELAARMAAVLGLQLSVSLHPDGDPVRDAAHLALIKRFRARLPPAVAVRTEVPIPIGGDRRSADLVLNGADLVPNGRAWRVLVEAETRLADVQAFERRLSSKQRDLGIDRVILLVADTRHNRQVIREHPMIRERFPTSMRSCLAALSRSGQPTGDALVIL